MADKKVTQLDTQTIFAAEDLLLIVDDPNGTPVSKKTTLKNLFGSIPANTVINGTFGVNGNTVLSGTVTANTDQLTITTSQTPANSTITVAQGTIMWDANYLYVATANNVLKRVALSTF